MESIDEAQLSGSEQQSQIGHSDERESNQEESTPEMAREHPYMHNYLPGEAHPLCTPELFEKQQLHRPSSRMELPVLHLPPGVILFPGATLPLRLKGSSGVFQYLKKAIDRLEHDWLPSYMQHEAASVVAIGLLPFKESEHGEDESDFSFPQDNNKNGLLRRIGTLAIVTHVSRNEGDSTVNANVSQQQQQPQEIVATALGIHRFQVLECLYDNRVDNGWISQRQNHRIRNLMRFELESFTGDLSDMDKCMVEILDQDDYLPKPPVTLVPRQYRRPLIITQQINVNPLHEHKTLESETEAKPETEAKTETEEKPKTEAKPETEEKTETEAKPKTCLYINVTSMLAKVSPIPICAWETVYPWKLVWLIQQELNASKTWHGLSMRVKNESPAMFSYWMALNLPLSRSKKLELLECRCLVKRLLFLLNYLLEENTGGREIQCAHCGFALSQLRYVFTVPGAEGTSGAYVNEHGIIHQTMTVRELYMQQRRVASQYNSRPKKRDSWFPGYAWTIANCAACLNHVGWKFTPVTAETIASPLKYFWGLTHSSIKIA